MKNIQKLLDTIRLSEGEGFQCDESAILSKYQDRNGEKSNLAIKILSVFGGLMASLAFIVFLFILGLYDSYWGMLLLGVVLVATAIGINRKFSSLILDTFSVSFYVLGLVLFAFGLAALNVSEDHVALLVILIALGGLAITQNYIISFISILAIGADILFLIISNNLYDAIHGYLLVYTTALAYCFLSEAKFLSGHPKLSKLYGPLRIGLLFSLIFGLVAIGKNDVVPISKDLIWVSSLAPIFFVLYLASSVLNKFQLSSTPNKGIVFALCALVLLPTLYAPAISGALLIVLLSFWVNYKTGLAIGIIALVYFVVQYYYDLKLSLLTKSIILFSSGVVFLAFYLFITKRAKP